MERMKWSLTLYSGISFALSFAVAWVVCGMTLRNMRGRLYLYAPCTPIAVFNQAFEPVLYVLGKYFCYCYKCRHPSLQLRGTSKWKTSPRNVGRCAATALVIVARLRQHKRGASPSLIHFSLELSWQIAAGTRGANKVEAAHCPSNTSNLYQTYPVHGHGILHYWAFMYC